MEKMDYSALARQVFKREGHAVSRLAETVDSEAFNTVMKAVLTCRANGGHVLTTGRGNSGAVARKIAYSLCCVEIPAVFLAPGEGYHASTGLIQPGDILVAISRGGDSQEVIELMKMARQKNAKVIAMTANPASPMAMSADMMLRVAIDRDAEAHDNLATSSMLAMIAMFDAIALCVEPDTLNRERGKE